MRSFSISLFYLMYSLSLCSHIELSGRIVDQAALLSPSQAEELDKILIEHEKNTGNQIVVVTLKSLEGKNIEDFAVQLGRKWGIGTKDKNDGVLLIIAPQEREVRIEVGYGLEGILTDARSKLIIERTILPYFRRGEMGEGTIEGVRALVADLGGNDDSVEDALKKEDEAPRYSWFNLFIFFVLVILFLLFRGRGSRSGGPSDFGSSSGGFKGGGGSFGGGGASGKWS